MGLALHAKAGKLMEREEYKEALEVLELAEVRIISFSHCFLGQAMKPTRGIRKFRLGWLAVCATLDLVQVADYPETSSPE